MRRDRNFRHNWNSDGRDPSRRQNKHFDKIKDATAEKKSRRHKRLKKIAFKPNHNSAESDVVKAYIRNPFVERTPNRIEHNNDVEPAYRQSHNEMRDRRTNSPHFSRRQPRVRRSSNFSPHGNHGQHFSNETFVNQRTECNEMTNSNNFLQSFSASCSSSNTYYNKPESLPRLMDIQIKQELIENEDPPDTKFSIPCLNIPQEIEEFPVVNKSPKKRRRIFSSTEVTEADFSHSSSADTWKGKSKSIFSATEVTVTDFSHSSSANVFKRKPNGFSSSTEVNEADFSHSSSANVFKGQSKRISNSTDVTEADFSHSSSANAFKRKPKGISSSTEVNEADLSHLSTNKRKNSTLDETLQTNFDIRISTATNATQTEEEPAKKPRKRKSGQKVCQLCEVIGHTEIQCLMICKNCEQPFHNMRTCPLPSQSQKTLSTFLEYCIKQFIDSDKV